MAYEEGTADMRRFKVVVEVIIVPATRGMRFPYRFVGSVSQSSSDLPPMSPRVVRRRTKEYILQ